MLKENFANLFNLSHLYDYPRSSSEDKLTSQASCKSFSLNKDGSYHYDCLLVDELIAANQELIFKIRRALPLSDEDYEQYIAPLIAAMGRIVSVLPASNGCHDIGVGGLFTHNLNVLYIAISNFVFDHPQLAFDEYRDKCLAIALTALAHDLGKVYTDVLIKYQEQYFNPYTQSLAAFITEVHASSIDVKFVEHRALKHDTYFPIALFALINEAHLMPILAHVNEVCSLLDFLARKDQLQEYVTKADMAAVSLSSSVGKNCVNSVDFIRQSLIHLVDGSINCAHSAVFAVEHGFIVCKDSPLLSDLSLSFAKLSTAHELDESNDSFQNLVLYMRERGALAFLGRNRIYSWFKLQDQERSFYVYGFLLKADDIDFEQLSYQPLGNKFPLELSAIADEVSTNCSLIVEHQISSDTHQAELATLEALATTFANNNDTLTKNYSSHYIDLSAQLNLLYEAISYTHNTAYQDLLKTRANSRLQKKAQHQKTLTARIRADKQQIQRISNYQDLIAQEILASSNLDDLDL